MSRHGLAGAWIALFAIFGAGMLSAQGVPDIVYYKLNEGTGTTTVNHASPGAGANPATISGTGTWNTTSPQLGAGAFDFASSTDGIDTGVNPSTTLTGDFTMECWVRATGNTPTFFVDNTPSFAVLHANGVATVTTLVGNLKGSTIIDGNWHHIAWVNDVTKGMMYLYVDGIQEDSLSNGGFAITGTALFVGPSGVFTGPGEEIDEIRIWSSARSAAQIVSGMNAELPITGPLMSVSRTTSVAPGGTDDLGAASGSVLPLTYTITNPGTTDLTLTTPVPTPTNLVNCTASVTTQPTTLVASGGGTTTMVVTVTPGATGPFSCDISVDNNTAGTNPYAWTISGIALPGVLYFDGFESGSVAANATEQVTGTFQTTTTFSGNIVGSPVSYATSSATTITGGPWGTLLPKSGSQFWALDFPAAGSPNAAGAIEYAYDLSAYDANTDEVFLSFLWAHSEEVDNFEDNVFISVNGGATWLSSIHNFYWGGPAFHWQLQVIDLSAELLSVSSNFSNQVLIRFQARGNMPAGQLGGDGLALDDVTIHADAPEMDVSFGAIPVANGDTLNTNILTIGSQLSFTISNSGVKDLTISGPITLTPGTNVTAGNLSISTAPASPVTPAGSTGFIVDVTPTATGPYNFTVSIDNSDIDENPYNFTVSGNANSNLPPVVTVTGSNWVDAGGGVFTLTLDPGDAISDALVATDPTPESMTVTVAAPTFAGLTAQPANIATPTAGPINLTWTGTADGSNAPGDYVWNIDINDGTSSTVIIARITINDVAPTHSILSADAGDGSVATPYTTTFTVGDTGAISVDLAAVSDANTTQTVTIDSTNQTSGPLGGTGFSFTLSGGSLTVTPAGTLGGADLATRIFDIDITDGTPANDQTITVSIRVLASSGAITFDQTTLPNGEVNSAYATTLTVTGSTGAVTFVLANGTTLPAGLTLNSSTGEISGTPTAAGATAFDIRVVDTLPDSATQTFTLTIDPVGGGGGGGGGASGGDGGDDDDGGCSTGDTGTSLLILLGLLSLVGVGCRARSSRV